jgi:hypothetical protein
MMRRVIELARKYYYGVFDEPKDNVTGDRKTWVPLTEWSVESVVKSIDLDTKDILIRPGNPVSVKVTPIIRSVIFDQLKRMGFGQLLNDTLRVLARDGTAVIKTVQADDKSDPKRKLNSRIVDLLNWWIDPAAPTIQESSAVIERIPVSESEVEQMTKGWGNVEFIPYSLSVPNIPNTFSPRRGEMKYTEVWDYWGKIRKSWISDDENDWDIWIEGHAIFTGIGGPAVLHLIEENPNKNGTRPYQEIWYKRVDGRWYGRGISEILFSLQEYTNTIVNIRKNNNLLLQNGIFLIRKGSGLTPDIISRIVAGGGLPVTDINRDVKQLTVQDFRQSSYTDEDRTYLMSDRVTGAFDINRGEAGLSSASATATLTRDRHVRDAFVLIQEGVGFAIENLIKKHYIPILKNTMTAKDIVRLTGRPEDLVTIDNAIIERRVAKWAMEKDAKTGFYPEPFEIDQFRVGQKEMIKELGQDRFVKYFKKIFDADVDIDILITDERFNRVVAVQQLRDMLIGFSRLPVASKLNTDAIMAEMLNLLGIRGEFFLNEPMPAGVTQQAKQAGRILKQLPEGVPSEQEAFSTAAGLPQAGRPALAEGREETQAPTQF